MRVTGRNGVATVVSTAIVAVAPACGGNSADRADQRSNAARAQGTAKVGGTSAGLIRNGPIFVVKWEPEPSPGVGQAYSVWRGTVGSPFRRLRGARIQSGAPCISSNGRWVAYLHARRPDIVVQRIKPGRDELGPRQVIGRLPLRRKSHFGDCVWSPRDQALMVIGSGVSGRSYVNAVWRIERNGQEVRELTRLPDMEYYWAPGNPAWSSAGRVAYHHSGSNRHWLGMMQADGTNLHRLNHAGHSPVWSPDGQRLAFIGLPGYSDEYAFTQPGPAMVADSDGDHADRMRAGRYAALAYSPNGRRLAFARTAYLRPSNDSYDELIITRANGTTTHTIRMPDSGFASTLTLMWSRTPRQP